MAIAGTREENFEDDIVNWLTTDGGYRLRAPRDFNLEAGVDSEELLEWLAFTQKEKLEELIKRSGSDASAAHHALFRRLGDELDRRGTMEVLRSGIKEQGLTFELTSFRPATTMNATHSAKYAANRLTVIRQFRYSPRHTNEIDLGLFLNGILVATAELKNPLTGQTVQHAMKQYENDREPSDPVLRRALVHFAVDPYLVYMTTKLDKKATEFLPFNRGHEQGKGNPPNPQGYGTAYLWQSVWTKDAWLDILNRFVRTTGSGRQRETIFPRYHQWDVVLKLEADARSNGAGHRYLIQHSAGSGKSKSISWLSHRLSTLYSTTDDKIFDKVLVITDRTILDTQLRADVEAFQRVQGAVVSIKGEGASKSEELKDALTSPAKIVVTTLQVFPYMFDKGMLSEVSEKRYAVIIDEAHSSQTGDAAQALKRVLGTPDIDETSEPEDAVNELVSARGQRPNLSFFAFTATPKDKTVELFGTLEAGVKVPFHLYSMRQAIEENFILDVLKNYVTYKTYFKLAVSSEESKNRVVETSRASAALRRMVVSDPDVISQKARIMVEHYRNHTQRRIAGKAKAMVVTDSRAAAVKYKRAIDAYVLEAGYKDLRTVVAFSGSVKESIAGEVTEASLNGFPEKETAGRFKGLPPFNPGEYQVLIVAEKFQTGFDEPLLHTMFVDKVLTGLNAVQTLSRLNRRHAEKADTFILDFRNDPDKIQVQFQRYYERTVTTPTSVNALTDAHDRLFNDWAVIDRDEVEAVVGTYFVVEDPHGALGRIYAAFDPAVERFGSLNEQDQADFRSALDSFISLYSFMSQIMTWSDVEMERTHIYGKALAKLIKGSPTGALELGDDVVLTHLRIESKFDGAIDLDRGQAPPGSAYPGAGQGRTATPSFDPLGEITEELNRQFGLELTERDRLMFKQFEVTWLGDEALRDVANANDLAGFKLEFERIFKGTILDNESANQDLYNRIYTDSDFSDAVLNFYLVRMYELLRKKDE